MVTKPFQFEGVKRMRMAEAGIEELQQFVDTLIVIPNQNLFRVANEKTTFADAFKMADDVLYSGVRGVTDLMIMPGLINLDFADIRTVMTEMGKAQMGTGEAEGDKRAIDAAEAAISNPLLDDVSMKGARGVLINITGGPDMTLFEVDEAANRIREEVDPEANIIFGSTFDETLEGRMRVSVVATGIDVDVAAAPKPSTVSWLSEHRRAAEREATASASLAAVRPFIPPAGTAAQAAAAAAPSAKPALEQEEAPSRDAERELDAVAAPAEKEETDLPFIAPRPVELSRSPEPAVGAQPAAEPEPFAAAAMANGAGEPAKTRSRGLSLFERVTGTGRARKAASQPPPELVGESPQPRLGELDSAERIAPPPSHDNILDIPAFLRRQAN